MPIENQNREGPTAIDRRELYLNADYQHKLYVAGEPIYL